MAGARGVIEVLGDVAEFAAQAIPGVDGAGVAMIEAGQATPRIQDVGGHRGIGATRSTSIQYEELKEGPVHHVYAVAAGHCQRIAGQ